MATFQKKTITKGQTVANRLKTSRLEQGFSLSDITKSTGIQKKYLEILENGDYLALPGDIYVRNWLKLYGKFLNLNISELLVDYKLEKSVGQKFVSLPTKKPKKIYKFLGPLFLKKALIAFLIFIVFAYLAWEINNIVSPPEVVINQPQNNTKTTDSVIFVSGKTEKEIQLNINGELVLLDAQGNFNKEVNLSVGLNNLVINAKKKHSKIRVLELNILRESTE